MKAGNRVGYCYFFVFIEGRVRVRVLFFRGGGVSFLDIIILGFLNVEYVYFGSKFL